MNIRFEIEQLLLRLGYRPEQKGICAGIYFTEYLILHGADLNKATREGVTPAFIAVKSGHVMARSSKI